MATELLRSSSWRRGRHRQRGRKTPIATTRVRSSTARSAKASCRWWSTASGSVSATHAATLGELQTLVADLQSSNAPVQLPILKKPSRVRGGGWASGPRWPGCSSRSASRSAGSLRQHQFAVEFHLRPGRQGRRCRAGGAHPAASTAYRGGWGDPTSGSKSADATLVDLSKFDVKTVIGVLRGSPENQLPELRFGAACVAFWLKSHCRCSAEYIGAILWREVLKRRSDGAKEVIRCWSSPS